MKIFLLRLLALTVISLPALVCHAQGVPEAPKPTIAKGSVIVYNVKEGNSSYVYTVTVTAFSESDGVELRWATNEKPARSGTSSMPFSSLANARNLLVKPVTGKEKLNGEQVRLFFSDDPLVTLVGTKTVDFSIDGKENTFLYLATKAETGDFDFNGKKITVDYTGADTGDVYVAFVAVGDGNLMHTFRAKGLQFNLQSVTTK